LAKLTSPPRADRVFRNLAVALEAVGCTAANLVKLTVFLRDMDILRAYREAEIASSQL
jgi:enamine deaminase RidA (YjgF/YER057c/UK114 family)